MSKKILVVEDNPANKKLAVLLLTHEGYEVLQAANAADGIAIAQECQPAMILMDIQLPDMDGLEATRLLKADARTQNIIVVALTAFAMAGDEERIRAAGCNGYIAKPIEYKAFLADVKRWLQENERIS